MYIYQIIVEILQCNNICNYSARHLVPNHTTHEYESVTTINSAGGTDDDTNISSKRVCHRQNNCDIGSWIL